MRRLQTQLKVGVTPQPGSAVVFRGGDVSADDLKALREATFGDGLIGVLTEHGWWAFRITSADFDSRTRTFSLQAVRGPLLEEESTQEVSLAP